MKTIPLAEPPFSSIQVTYHEAVSFTVHAACHEIDDQLRARRVRSQDDVMRAIIGGVVRAFEAGAIWRDINPDAPMGPQS